MILSRASQISKPFLSCVESINNVKVLLILQGHLHSFWIFVRISFRISIIKQVLPFIIIANLSFHSPKDSDHRRTLSPHESFVSFLCVLGTFSPLFSLALILSYSPYFLYFFLAIRVFLFYFDTLRANFFFVNFIFF